MRLTSQAGNENIVTQEADYETLVYDLSTDKDYCLNETSAKVYAAFGNNMMFKDLSSKHIFTGDLIYFALGEFAALLGAFALSKLEW